MALFEDVSGLIREARIRARLSQERLAAEAEISQRTVSGYETGRNPPPANVLGRILAACGIRSLGELQRLIDQVEGVSEVREPHFRPDDVARAFPETPAELHRRMADLYEEISTLTDRLRSARSDSPKE